MDQKSLLAFIKSRRTCYQFVAKKESPVTEEQIHICLDAAITAPNHKLTQPWLFWTAGQETTSALADIYADNRASKNAERGSDKYNQLYANAVEKFNLIPSVILVGQTLADDEVTRKEDYAACACAIQNFQLMAWSQDLGMQWSTGPIISDQRTYDLLGISKDQVELIGALYIGHINEGLKPNNQLKRKPLNEVLLTLR